MGFGLLAGLGSGLSQAGQNLYETAKQDRINEFKSKEAQVERDARSAEAATQREWQEKQTHNQNVNNWLTNYARDERLNKQKVDQLKLADEIEDGNRKNYKPSLWLDQFGNQNTEGVGIALRQKDQYGEEAEISGAMDLWKARFGNSNGSGTGGSAKGWFSTTQKVYSGENDPLGQPVVVGERTIMYNRDMGLMRVIEPNGKMSERILSPEQADELTSRLGERASQAQRGVDEQAARAAARHQANPGNHDAEYQKFIAANGGEPAGGKGLIGSAVSRPEAKPSSKPGTLQGDVIDPAVSSVVNGGESLQNYLQSLSIISMIKDDPSLLPSMIKQYPFIADHPEIKRMQGMVAGIQ